MTFQQWIDALVKDQFGTKTKLAQAIGVSLTQIGRGADAGKYGVVNLLKLAKVAHADPSFVLRLAGKADVADLIESLYGTAELTPDQRAWLTTLAATNDDGQVAATGILESLKRAFPRNQPQQQLPLRNVRTPPVIVHSGRTARGKR